MKKADLRFNSYTRPTTPEEAEAAIARSKESRRKRGIEKRNTPKRVVKDNNFAEVQARIHDVKIPYTLSLININEIPLDKTFTMKNQIMVMYKNGTFDVLPQGVNGLNIRDYLGFKYSRIVFWTMLPLKSSPNHFHTFPSSLLNRFEVAKAPNDIFDL